jgi:type II secretory pathway pseudopilin PulG
MKKINFKNFLKLSKGLTLTEILVTIAIIIILSGLIIANSGAGKSQLALSRSANKLAQDIRRAQEMAMSAKECPTGTGCADQVPPGYGIYLHQGDKNYLLYADTNPNQIYGGGDTDIETINFEKGIFIKDVGPANVSINFKPPDPKINITGVGNEVLIEIALMADSTRTKTIRVNKAGLIDVE